MRTSRLIAFLLVAGCLLILAAAPSSIGTVRSPGQFLVNGSAISGNSTLFDGDVLETTGARSVVQLADGQLTLGPSSRARIFRDHTVLERGSGTLSAALSQSVEADTLHIAPTVKQSVVQVEISAPNLVSVTARDGAAEVRNSTGILVASMHSGMALAFEPQAANPSTIKIAGKLESSSGRYSLTDCNTKVKYELRGAALANHVGQTVEVTGTSIAGATVATGVSQAVQVTIIQPAAASACPAGGAAATGAAQGQEPTKLSISILEGEGAINNIAQRVSREAMVQVEDENHKPVSGAAVTFLLPDSGASGVFSNGSRALTVMTDNAGSAVARGIVPNNVVGDVPIRVEARFKNLDANTTIHTRNAVVAGAAAGAGGAGAGAIAGLAKGLSSGAIIAIVGGVAVAGTMGGLAATGTFSGTSASTP